MRYIKKALTLLASALGVLILSGFLSLRPIAQTPAFAHHTDVNGCYDVTMTPIEKTLTDPGSPDAGRLEFNAFGHDYQACIESKNNGDNFVRGWTWNNNLGYVSMSCQSGQNPSTAPNANCGGIDYSVVANPNDGKGVKDGRVRGFAWGDNIGWISMGCDADGQNMGTACGAIAYGVRVAKVDGEINPLTGAVATCLSADLSASVAVKKDDAYGYAWSDSVGWINFCGAHLPLFNDPPVTTTANLRYEKFPQNATTVANGDDYYKIIVEVKKDGVLALGAQPAAVSVEAIDIVNTVKADQIANNGNGGIVPTKNDFTWDGVLGAYTALVSAVAPTDVSHATNSIKLKSITVKIEGLNYQLEENNKYFDFSPAVSVLRVVSDATPGVIGDSLFGIAGAPPTNHEVRVSGNLPSNKMVFNGSRIYTQLHDCSDDFDFTFHPEQDNGNTNGAIKRGGVCTTLPGVDTVTATDKGTDDIQGTPLADLDNANDADPTTFRYIRGIGVIVQAGKIPTKAVNTSAFGILTRVEYTAVTKGGIVVGNVRYVSHKTTDGSLVSQAADVRGDVRIDTQKSLIDGNISRSIGDSAQSKREPFYRAIKKLSSPTDTNGQVTLSSANLSAGSSILYYRRPKNGAACRIVLSDNANMTFNKNVTIIAEGCDVYIDQNIRLDGALKQLGIIVLEDIRSNDIRRGGNIYVCATVTDIVNVNMVADGGLMSYGTTGGPCDKNTIGNDGLPTFIAGPRTSLKNQLIIIGSVISNNTYGGSLLSPPILGDGTRVTNPADSYKARLFDINFLRYANTVPNPDGLGGECWEGTLSAKLPQGCGNNNPANASIVNVRYQAPSSDLPVFNIVGK